MMKNNHFLMILFILFFSIVLASNGFATGTVVYQNDFNGDLSGWVQSSGTWSIVSGWARGTLDDGQSMGTFVPMDLTGLATDENYMISFRVRGVSGDDIRSMYFLSNAVDFASTTSAYRGLTRPANPALVAKFNAAGFISSGTGVADGVIADINIAVNSGSRFTFWVNNVLAGSAVQNTWTSGSYIALGAENTAPGAVIEWDNIKILRCTNNNCSLTPTPPSNVPDININYPNSPGLFVSGTKSIDFNINDGNAGSLYDFNLSVRRTDTNQSTVIVQNASASTFCSNVGTINPKHCQYGFNFNSLVLGVNYVIDANVTNNLPQPNTGTKTGASFQRTPNVGPSNLTIIFPNSNGLTIAGIADFNFTFTDPDFNFGKYDYNIALHRVDNNAVTIVVTDANAYTACSNMDSNATTKVCLYTYNFGASLPHGVAFIADVNVSDSIDKNIAHAQFSFTVPVAAPSVDFTFSPNPPSVFAPITFTPIVTTSFDLNGLYWQFGTDGNNNQTRIYYPGSQSTLFTDDFSAGNLNNWDVNSGTWSATSNYLNGPSLDNGSISADVNMIPGGDYNISYRNDPSVAVLNNEVIFYTDQNGIENINGYGVVLQSGTVVFRKWVNGTPSNLFGGGGVATGSFHDVNVNIKSNGFVQLYVDGSLIGSTTDTTYTNGTKLVVTATNGSGAGKWDNFIVKGLLPPHFIPSSPIDYTATTMHTFTTGITQNVCLTAQNQDGNTTACHSLAFTGQSQLRVFDENTHLPITNASAKFNGTTYGSIAGVISIPTPTESEDETFEIYATGYPSRFFTYRVDVNTLIADSVYLLDENKGREIQFLIRDLNETKYPYNFLRIMKDQNVVSRVYLDNKAISIPIYVANITTDYNFFIDVNSSSNTNIFNYGNTTLEVDIPKNESLLFQVSPYNISISDLTSVDLNGLTTTSYYRIYPNTFHPYHITIDANSQDYFFRYYDLRSLGGQTISVLQPYLLRAIDSGIPATMIVKDSLSSLSLQYYVFKFYTDLNQMANVLVESPQTDTAGTFIFTTVTGKNYFLKIYDQYGDLLKQGQFVSSTSTQYFIDLFSGVIADKEPNVGNVDINLLIPNNNFFFLNDSNNFGIRFITYTNGPSITSVNVQVFNGTDLISGTTFTPAFPATSFPTNTQFDANFSTSLNNINTKVIITVTSSIGNVTKSYMFPLKQDTNPQISFPGFTNFCSSVGGFGCALIWLFIGILISIGLRFNPIFGVDNNGMFWVMAIWTGIAAFIGIVPYQIGFIAILAGASFWAIRNRPIG